MSGETLAINLDDFAGTTDDEKWASAIESARTTNSESIVLNFHRDVRITAPVTLTKGMVVNGNGHSMVVLSPEGWKGVVVHGGRAEIKWPQENQCDPVIRPTNEDGMVLECEVHETVEFFLYRTASSVPWSQLQMAVERHHKHYYTHAFRD